MMAGANQRHQDIAANTLTSLRTQLRGSRCRSTAADTAVTTNGNLRYPDVVVDCGPGARIRGQVASGALKNMVWISPEPGSNLPGHWVEEGSPEAKAARHYNAHAVSREAVQVIQR